jgi:hypothetical protein
MGAGSPMPPSRSPAGSARVLDVHTGACVSLSGEAAAYKYGARWKRTVGWGGWGAGGPGGGLAGRGG